MMDTETIKTVWTTIANNIIPIIILASVFIEITPIKFNPLSALVEWIFKPIRKELGEVKTQFNNDLVNMEKQFNSEIAGVKKEYSNIIEILDRIETKEDKRRFMTIRWEVLEFANSLTNGVLHAQHEYDHIRDDIVEYGELHAKYEFTNGYLEEAIKDIDSHYNDYKDQDTKFF